MRLEIDEKESKLFCDNWRSDWALNALVQKMSEQDEPDVPTMTLEEFLYEVKVESMQAAGLLDSLPPESAVDILSC